MTECPGMLLIGAAHRNAGKTEFACAVIRRVAPAHRVAAIKVTCIDEREDLVSREDDHVVADVPGSHRLSLETRDDLTRDTSRLLRAGATPVLWLRARRDHVAAGLVAALARIPADHLIVCESNSARLVVTPDVFIVARRADDASIKPSCAAVVDRADRIAVFHGDGWDLPPDSLAVADGRWVLRPGG